MQKIIPLLCCLLLTATTGQAQRDTAFAEVAGLAIAAPQPDGLDRFLQFMTEELAPNGINTLVLRVDFNYQYESYPNLRNEKALSKAEVGRLVATAQRLGIELIPQINLLGHQSWAERLGNLLREYPQFDETPHVAMPEKYEWPNEDGLYCKSYCPLHPDVHAVVFALVDEIMQAFEADAFHAGMDEVFYIADAQCPRCAGLDPAVLFAQEVTRIRNHLAASGRELWIWGDRLLEGEISGLGMWEASANDTDPAIDLIPKDVVICDWHYNRADPTPVIFAAKGLPVVACFWNKPAVATAYLEMMDLLRDNSTPAMADRYRGTMQTIWSPAERFLDAYYGISDDENSQAQVASLRAMWAYLAAKE